MSDFDEFFRVCGKLHVFGQLGPIKIWAESLKGFRSYGGLKLGGAFPREFQRL